MNEMIHNGVVKPIEGYDSPIYILKEEADFSITEYKMMGNLSTLLKCRKASLNGELELIHLTNGYTPLKSVMPNLTKEKLANAISNICDAFLEIKNNGFMHCNSVALTSEKVYINPSTQSVRLVYIPISNGNTKNKFSAAEINAFFTGLIKESGLVETNVIEAVSAYGLNNSDTSLEEIRNYYNRALNGTIENETHAVRNTVNNVLRLRARDRSMNIDFVVNQDKFILGKKKDAVDGAFPNDPTLGISRKHCEIIREGTKYYASDLGSLNGTFVNNVKLLPGERIELHNNDLLRLSNTVLSVEITEG